jgi:hypothetical protein
MAGFHRHARPVLAVLAAGAAAASIAAGPVAAQAMARSTPAPQAANNGATSPSLSLAIGQKGDPEVAAIGKHATLLYYTIVRGKWRRTQVAGPGTAQSGPSLVSLGAGKASIAVEGPHNELLLFNLRFGHWSRQIIAGPGSAGSTPSLASGPDGLAIAVDGPDQSLWFYWFEISHWHSTRVLVPTSAYSAPSLEIRGTQGAITGDPATEADIAVEGFDHDLIYAHAIPGLTFWTATSPGSGEALAYSAPSLLIVHGSGEIQGFGLMVVEGPHHRLTVVTDERGVFVIRDPAASNNTVYSAPSAAQNFGDSEREFPIVYQGRASKVFDLVTYANSVRETVDIVGSVRADSAPVAAAGAPKASTDDVIVEGVGNTLWYFDGAKPSSNTGVPRFAGTEIAGGGSTFAG